MKAISIKQPWANMIRNGDKTIETRTWYTSHRGKIVICSSRNPKIHPAGYAIAIADLVDCRPMTVRDEVAARCATYPGAYAWVLRNVAPLIPVKVKGRLRIFNLDIQVKEGRPKAHVPLPADGE